VTAGVKSEHAEELFRILDPRFIRRLKKSVLPQLPEKIYTTRYVRMETPGGGMSKQGVAYESMRKEMLAELDGGILMASDPLAKAIRLTQFASACGAIVDGNLVLTEPSCKVDALEEILLELGDEKAVVFAESRQLIELAHARLVKLSGVKSGPFFGLKFGIITGRVPEQDRSEYVRQFQGGGLKAILLTLGAGGEGLTLTTASTVIFLQRSWNSVQNTQAEDRVHRIGQDSSVTIIDVVTEGTIEERIRAGLRGKAAMAEEICRDEERMREWLKK
jgi:SNF2 family DNA or RNA helicase